MIGIFAKSGATIGGFPRQWCFCACFGAKHHKKSYISPLPDFGKG
jgi:hypothetical protein